MRILYFMIMPLLCTSLFCGCNQKKGTYYNTDSSDTGESISVNSKHTTDSLRKSNVRLSILTSSPSEDLTEDAVDILQNKVLDIVSKQNIPVIGADPCYAMVTTVKKTSEALTSTVPTKHKISYMVNYYVGNTITGEVYGTCSVNLTGIGDSKQKASLNAVRSIKSSPELRRMLSDASNTIIESYQNDSIGFFNRVKKLIDLGKYNLALNVLNSVPSEAYGVYNKAQALIPELTKRYKEQIGKNSLVQIKLITGESDQYNPDVVAYYSVIPDDSPYKEEAAKIIDKYVATWDKNIQESIQYNQYKEKEELAIRKLNAQLNVEANEELLNIYRQMGRNQELPQQKEENITTSFFKTLVNSALPVGVEKIINYMFFN